MERPKFIDPKTLEAKIKEQQQGNPYFALFHGERVLRSNVLKFAPETMAAIDVLLKEGRLIGESLLFPGSGIEGDVVYFMPESEGKSVIRQLADREQRRSSQG